MNRYIYSCFALIFTPLFTSIKIKANPVDANTALQVAKNYYSQKSISNNASFFLSHTEKSATGDTAVYYIFNINENDGWIIIAADDASLPVLGYSLSGHHAINNFSPEFEYWINNYREQIIYIKRNGLQANASIQNEWEVYKNNFQNSLSTPVSGVGPLLTTKWGQGIFYNSLCPNTNSPLGIVPTGCVATAMAQIMKYWNYPEKGIGSHSYTDLRTQYSGNVYYPPYGVQSANFANTTYKWSCMPDFLNGSNSAVATLMYHCGVSVEMDYAPNPPGSTSQTLFLDNWENQHGYCAERAFVRFFDYNPDLIKGKLKRDFSSDLEWINMLKDELNNQRPILYSGFNLTTNIGGHAWVCDGYTSDNKFCMNWGWDGLYNGNFTVGSLNPGTENFTQGQNALIGIKPNGNYPRCTNDECTDAEILQACERRVVDNFHATASTSVPNFSCYPGDNNDVWFKIIPTTTSLSVETYQAPSCGLSNLVMQVLSGSCGNLREIACSFQNAGHPKVVLNNLPNLKPLYIRITSLGGQQFGEFGILYKKIAPGSDIFTSSQFISGDGAGIHQYPALTGDVNGDGKTDLIFTYYSPANGLTIRTKISNGDGTFRTYSQALGDGKGVFNYPVLTGDVNGDSKTDLIFTYYSPTNGLIIRTKISNGDGTFNAYSQALGDGKGVFNYPVLTGDVNGDSKTDLIFTYYSSVSGLTIRTKISNGDSTFSAYSQALGDGNGVFNYPALIGDINGDGKTDLIFIGQDWNGNTNLNVRVKMSNGDGTFTAYSQVLGDGNGIHQYPALTGDVNGDGKTDLIFVGQDWNGNTNLNVRVKMSNGNGTFTPYSQILGDGNGVHDYPALTGDVNGDGKTDLVFVGQDWTGCGLNIRVKLSNGDGTWCADWQVTGDGSAVFTYPVLTGDINNDHKTDLIFTFDSDANGFMIRTKITKSNYSCGAQNSSTDSSSGSQASSDYLIYPNPTNNYIQIRSINPQTVQLTLINAQGIVVNTYNQFNTERDRINLSLLQNGIYFINILNSVTGERTTRKVIKIAN